MAYLLYCILNRPQDRELKTITGVGDQPVLLVSTHGLSAAVSKSRDRIVAPETTEVIAYKKVVETFHRGHTVIPMRFGCFLDNESQISRLLEDRHDQYKVLLRDLDGCVEMGIRMMIKTSRLPIPDWEGQSWQPGTGNPAPETSGRAFLEARRSYYKKENTVDEIMNKAAHRCQEAFSGVFAKYKKEGSRHGGFQSLSASQNPILSLYFLVSRDGVASFCRVFRNAHWPKYTKLLLSGPWPPYNFVLPDHPGDLDFAHAIGGGTNGA
ncbi:MAG: GvpL/GvpF family gas vesicle protein [Deltaproteobacteria bacterium]|nr:GvpL/GvpF family gas vesicle protein [Deltaproteobacteria bacterium]